MAPGPCTDQWTPRSPCDPLVFGPQSASSYQRDEVPAASTLGVSGDSARLDMLSTAGLDLIVRGFAYTVGATAGLMAVSDKAGELVRVLSARGDAMALDDLPASLTGGFCGPRVQFRTRGPRTAVVRRRPVERGGRRAQRDVSGERRHPLGDRVDGRAVRGLPGPPARRSRRFAGRGGVAWAPRLPVPG